VYHVPLTPADHAADPDDGSPADPVCDSHFAETMIRLLVEDSRVWADPVTVPESMP